MKFLNLEGLVHYTTKLLNKITEMINAKADVEHTHDYLPLSGGTMTDTINSSKTTNRYLLGNQGNTIINSTASAGSYTILDKLNSTNGYFTDGVYGVKRLFQYTSKDAVDAESNSITKTLTLLNEDGDSFFPGIVSGSFNGDLSGNASTASKWNTARTLTLYGDYSGSVSIDGNSNVTLTGYNYHCKAVKGNTNYYPYGRIAHVEGTSSYTDRAILLYVAQNCHGGRFGLIRVCLRANNQAEDSTQDPATVEAKWLVRSGFNTEDFVVGIHSEKSNWYADLFYKFPNTYTSIVAKQLDAGGRGQVGRTWTLINCNEPSNSSSTENTTTECYATIEDYDNTYTSVVESVDDGTVEIATYAQNSDMVDGWNVSASTSYSLKPIGYGTSDMTAGTSTLSTGCVYLQYE